MLQTALMTVLHLAVMGCVVWCVAGTMLPTADHRPGLGAGWMTSGPGLTHTLSRSPLVRVAHMNPVEWGWAMSVGARIGPISMHHQPMKPMAHLPSAVR